MTLALTVLITPHVGGAMKGTRMALVNVMRAGLQVLWTDRQSIIKKNRQVQPHAQVPGLGPTAPPALLLKRSGILRPVPYVSVTGTLSAPPLVFASNHASTIPKVIIARGVQRDFLDTQSMEENAASVSVMSKALFVTTEVGTAIAPLKVCMIFY